MAPWDEQTYFDIPSATLINVPVNTPTKVLSARPNRVGVILSAVATSNVTWWIDSTVSSQKGLPSTPQTPIIYIYQRDWGSLPAQEWWSFNTVGLNVFAIELVLREWPVEQDRMTNDKRLQHYLSQISPQG